MNTQTNTAKMPVEILIVEDSQTQAEKLRYILEGNGYLIRHAKNGKQAMDYLCEYHPSLVISDIIMPQMNGYELCKNIKLSEHTRDIPVILMTSLASAEDVIESLACGADSFITKPYSESYILNQIDGVLVSKLLHQNEGTQNRVDIILTNKNRKVTVNSQRMASLLISTYEVAIEKNKELIRTQDELVSINENLEDIVKEKTIELITENEIRKKSENELFEAQRIAHIGSFEYDVQSCRLTCTNEGLSICGVKREEFSEAPDAILQYIHPEDREHVLQVIARAINEKSVDEHTVRIIRPNGEERIVNVRFVPAFDANGNHIRTTGTVQDITEQEIAGKAVRESEKKYRLLITQMAQGLAVHEVVINDAGSVIDYRFLDVNQGFERMTGLKREDIIGKTVLEIMPKTESYWIEKFGEVALTGEPLFYENYSRELGRYYEVVAYSTQLNQFAVIYNDTTDRKKTKDHLIHMIYHDQLTGLYNRRFFEDELKRLDTKTNLPVSIIMCDINGLKLINDSFGHSSGDKLLRKAAEIIKKACQGGGTVSRLGGDEFAIILPKTDAEETIQIAKRIKEFASKEKVGKIELSISYGYDTKITDEQSMIEIYANAENRMYIHKLYERSSMRSKTIDLIMNTLFEKSNRESMHSDRVSSICQAIASKMNFDKGNVDKMRIAGLVHDIGKMGIDDKILNKAGSLSSDERHEIERHPEIGWRILCTTNEFLELAQFVLAHHERWDGGGYPNGLKGEKIPLEARIITIADAYDAITSERSYRKGLDKEEAIIEMKRCSGTQFDPEILDVFVNQVLPYNSNFGG